MAFTVTASLTDVGRQRLAQQLISGKSFVVSEFAINSAGHDPQNPTIALTPDTTAIICPGGTPLYSRTINATTLLSVFCPQFQCIVPETIVGSVSNICLIGQVVYSPISGDPDIGTTFLFAVGNFPLKVKTSADVFNFLVSVQF